MSHRLNLGLLSTSLLLGACQAQAPAAPSGPPGAGLAARPHQVLHGGSQCGTEGPSVQRITTPGELQQIMQGHTLGATATVPAVNFEHSLVLRVSPGQQPNPGYGLNITAARVEGSPQRLVLSGTWVQPQQGRMYPMVVTQPCVIVSVPRGGYRSVVVVDAQGQERITAPLSGSTR